MSLYHTSKLFLTIDCQISFIIPLRNLIYFCKGTLNFALQNESTRVFVVIPSIDLQGTQVKKSVYLKPPLTFIINSPLQYLTSTKKKKVVVSIFYNTFYSGNKK